ncbi:hypothetical protein [Mesorhizobium hawassense]|uniref:hypothetical protein n=1 Tax=Mesorhizobium hawassense TaxID=1209954 RepID=UPI00142D4B1F|nr:hypothetical protein [Mesorhizobium hawassense]
MRVNEGGDNTPIRILGELKNIVDDEVWYFTKPFRALIHHAVLANWWLSGQAESHSVELGVALGKVLSVE